MASGKQELLTPILASLSDVQGCARHATWLLSLIISLQFRTGLSACCLSVHARAATAHRHVSECKAARNCRGMVAGMVL